MMYLRCWFIWDI